MFCGILLVTEAFFYTYLHIMAQIELSLEFGLTTNMAYFQALQKYFINSILTLES